MERTRRRGLAKQLSAVLLLGTLAAGVLPAVASKIASRDYPIIDGAPAEDPSVVAIVDADGTPFCTGTAVATRLVLTAAHCVVEPELVRAVFVGRDVRAGGAQLEVIAAQLHPYYDPESRAFDVALVQLIPGVALRPVPYRTEPISPEWRGRALRLVGFGRAARDTSSWSKRQTERTLDDLQPAQFFYGESTCFGDSGGPVLTTTDAGEILLGVISSGGPGCRFYGRAVRADAVAEWLDAQIALHGDRGSQAPEASGCSGTGTPVSAPWAVVAVFALALAIRKAVRMA